MEFNVEYRYRLEMNNDTNTSMERGQLFCCSTEIIVITVICVYTSIRHYFAILLL